MPRLFTGLALPDTIAAELAAMRGGVHGARWIEPGNFHITLRFIGDIDADVAADVARALDELRFPAFTLALKGAGTFGGDKPRSIWAGVASEDGALAHLQMLNERALTRIGLKPERRKFTPHVTLARLRAGSAGEAERFAAEHNLYESAPFDVTGFELYSARPGRGGGPYVSEAHYPLEDMSSSFEEI